MMILRSILSGFLVLSVVLFPAASGRGEPPLVEVRKIGVVNLNRVFKDYEGTKSQESKLEKVSGEKQAERERQVEEIRNMRDELALLNDESREKQRQAVEEKLRDLAQFDQQAREWLRGQREEALQALLKEIEGIVTGYAKQKGYDLILTDRAALYFSEGMDVTEEILSLLNQRYSKKKPA
jgi:outer membrane protein